MKVLFCTNIYPPKFIGGAELIVHNQAKALKQLGHHPAVFTGDIRGKYPRHSFWREDWEGVPVYRVALTSEDFRSEGVNFINAAVEQHFAGILEQLQPDIAHMHNLIGLSVRLIRMAKEKGARTLLTLHDHWGFCFKNTLLKTEREVCTDFSRCSECMPFIEDVGATRLPIERRNDFLRSRLSEVDAFISPSFYLAHAYIKAGFPVGRMRVIANGVDVERFSKVQKAPRGGRMRFTLIGHLGHHKGAQVLLQALTLLGDPERLLLNVVGEGELAEPLRQRIAELGLSRSVRFWGHLQNDRIEQVFAATDVLVLPSIWPENQPVSITEAMATRTPVIASRAGGIPELVEDGRTGYLFKTGDAGELAGKMRLFLDHPDQIGPLGERGFAKIANMTFRSQVKRILRVCEEHAEPVAAFPPALPYPMAMAADS